MALEDLSGRVFGKWTVRESAGRDRSGNDCWNCQCECGRVCLVRGTRLRKCRSKSCKSCSQITHGEYSGGRVSPEAKCLEHVIQRCYNPKDISYKFYGLRGITVCERWLGEDRVENFIADMGRRPSGKHSLDRIDGDRNYCPENCRWATDLEQSRNRKWGRFLTYNGETKRSSEWVEIFGLNLKTLSWRINSGWTVERALTTPIAKSSCNVVVQQQGSDTNAA